MLPLLVSPRRLFILCVCVVIVYQLATIQDVSSPLPQWLDHFDSSHPLPHLEQKALLDKLPLAWEMLEKDGTRDSFSHVHNHRTLTRLQDCLEMSSCSEEATKLAVFQYSYYQEADGKSTKGEDLWAISVLRSLERLGYSALIVQQDVESLMGWHVIFGDHVAVYGVEAISLQTKDHFYQCLNSTECIQRPSFPSGIPLGKMLVHSWWENPLDSMPGVENRDFQWVSDVIHPLGNEWIATPYDFGGHFYLGYTIECDGTVIPAEEREDRALILAKKISYFSGGRGSEQSAYPLDSYGPISSHTGLEFVAIAPYPEEWEGIYYYKEDVPDGVTLYPLEEGQMTLDRAEYDTILAKSQSLVGIGFPGCSPSPYYGLCKGVPFINPHHVNAPPQTEWYKTNMIFQWQTYQHGPLAAYGAPYVYNIPFNNATALEEALLTIKQNPIGSFVPETMQHDAMDDRVRMMMEADWVGKANVRMAELGVKEAEELVPWSGKTVG